MRFAVIGDIHGNKYALESVLKDIEDKDVDFIFSTGDLVGYMPYPNQVIDLIRKHKICSVQGNHDRAIANGNKVGEDIIQSLTDQKIQENASNIFTNWCITDENRNYLNGLPEKIIMEFNSKKIIITHGSPMKIDEYLYDKEDILIQAAKKIDEDVIICGHTHIPYIRKTNEKYFINAGSVGKPRHGDRNSTYVIIELVGEEITCTIEKVEYNLEQLIEDINKNRMISDALVEMLTKGI